MAVTAKIEGNKLVITADLETPTPSASGKTLVAGIPAISVQQVGPNVLICRNSFLDNIK